MSDLENITKYLLNYLFKRIDDLTNELFRLKVEEGINAEHKRLAKEAEDMLKDLMPAFKKNPSLMVDEDEDDGHDA